MAAPTHAFPTRTRPPVATMLPAPEIVFPGFPLRGAKVPNVGLPLTADSRGPTPPNQEDASAPLPCSDASARTASVRRMGVCRQTKTTELASESGRMGEPPKAIAPDEGLAPHRTSGRHTPVGSPPPPTSADAGYAVLAQSSAACGYPGTLPHSAASEGRRIGPIQARRRRQMERAGHHRGHGLRSRYMPEVGHTQAVRLR